MQIELHEVYGGWRGNLYDDDAQQWHLRVGTVAGEVVLTVMRVGEHRLTPSMLTQAQAWSLVQRVAEVTGYKPEQVDLWVKG